MKKLTICIILITSLSCRGQDEKKEYTVLVSEIAIKRDSLSLKYAQADSSIKDTVLQEAHDYLVKSFDAIFPYWYGAEWDFNGTTRTPKKGKIACGYFVTNILSDVGFKIPRVKWAQSASEVFIKKLAFGNIKRFSNKPISNVKEYLLKAGNGIYVVGLDSHTGYISVKDGAINFIHADYYEPEIGVVSEKLDSDNPLADSSYRVIGKLMEDEMIIFWLKNKALH